MFEDQTVDLLPARTTLQAGAGGAGGRGGRGGDAIAVSAAVIFVGGDVDDSTLSATSAAATATGGARPRSTRRDLHGAGADRHVVREHRQRDPVSGGGPASEGMAERAVSA